MICVVRTVSDTFIHKFSMSIRKNSSASLESSARRHLESVTTTLIDMVMLGGHNNIRNLISMHGHLEAVPRQMCPL